MYQNKFQITSIAAIAILVTACAVPSSAFADPPKMRSGGSKAKPAAKQEKVAESRSDFTASEKQSKSNNTGTAVPPADATLTLYVLPVTGLTHVEQAKTLKEQLIAQTGLKDFYIVHGEADSALYYGYYRDFIGTADTKEKARAEAERTKIASVKDRAGDLPFRGATFVNVDTPDPEGPAEWNLANTPPDRTWSWEIAAYADHPDRKQYAVDAVREARKSGVEAYYFHGSKASSVCVGAFGAEALKPQDSNVQNKAEGSDAPLVVLPTALPAGMDPDGLFVTENGRRVRANVVVPRIEPVDPNLIAIMRAYPHYSYNGEELVTISKDPRTGREVRRRQESTLVTIQHAVDDTATGQQPGAGGLNPRALAPRQRQRPDSRVEGLRGIGE